MSLNKKKVDFNSVIISAEKIRQVESSISQIEKGSKIFDEWGFGEVFEKGTAVSMIFHGIPGTGKTMMAQAIANKLGQELLVIGPAEVETPVPGGAERNIKKFFRIASAQESPDDPNAEVDERTGRPAKSSLPKKKHVLLFDECDSLITNRGNVGMIIAGQINTLLSELETFDGVVIFTTNRLGNLDAAIERRISAKIEFEFPNEELRKRIWARMIPKNAPLKNDVDFDKLAKFALTGGNIKNCVLNAARMAAFQNLNKIDLQCFLDAIEKEVEGLISFQKAMKEVYSSVGREDLQKTASGRLEKIRSPKIDHTKEIKEAYNKAQ